MRAQVGGQAPEPEAQVARIHEIAAAIRSGEDDLVFEKAFCLADADGEIMDPAVPLSKLEDDLYLEHPSLTVKAIAPLLKNKDREVRQRALLMASRLKKTAVPQAERRSAAETSSPERRQAHPAGQPAR